MSEALIVLNPRRIPACIAAIEKLDIATCWLSYMAEPEAAEAANTVVGACPYERYVVVSDDTLPTQAALDRVLEVADEGYPVVTGYCNLDEADYLGVVNLTRNVLPAPPPSPPCYQFMARAEVEAHTDLCTTTFAGLALTCITRDVWLEHPLTTTSYGGQMDYALSYDLQEASIPIVAPVGAYVHHVKEHWNHADQSPHKRLLVGHKRPALTWTYPPVAA